MSNKNKILACIDSYKETVIELETKLTAIPAIAPESGGKGEMEKAKFLVSWLESKGIVDIERFDIPDDRVPDGIRPCIVATIKGSLPGNRFWIMSHLDVVPEGDLSQWKTDPFKATVIDGKIYGRGVEDNHQGLVSSVLVALSFIETKTVPLHDLKLLFVPDEENGSKFGVRWLLANKNIFEKDDRIVIPDHGVPNGEEIVIAEKNICWLKIITKGKQCHASLPDTGANAFLANCELALKFNALETEVFTARDPIFIPNRTTITPTKKESNVPNINTIPGEDIFYTDMRILPSYTVDMVLSECEKKMREVEKKYNVTMSYEIINRSESPSTPADAPIVPILMNAINEVYGVKGKVVGVGGNTVGAFLRAAGYHCVVWSRLDETMHSPNEYAIIDYIIGDAKVFASILLEE